MPLYRALIGFSYVGQRMANILWYRDTGGVIGLDSITAQSGLAVAVRDNVVLGGAVGQVRLADILPNETLFDEVSVQRIDAVTFQPMTNAPSVANINLPSLSGNDSNQPMHCAIMQLICPASTISPLDYSPKRGYLAVGPIAAGSSDVQGVLTPGAQGFFNQLGAAILQVQAMGGGFTATPIRVGRGLNSLGQLTRGFNDIQTVSVRPATSFRRSRNPQ